MDYTLQQIEDMLRTGMNLAGQGSYRRRAPESAAIPTVSIARAALREFINCHPESERAWRLLMLAEESFLNYRAARHCLEQAMRLSGRRDKKDLKKLVQYREYQAEWDDLRLEPAELQELGDYLRLQLGSATGERSLKHTTIWLRRHKPRDAEAVLAALDRRGAYSDFQVLSNVVLP